MLADLAPFAFVTRGKEYRVLDHPLVQARLHLPPDQFQQHPESQVGRSLYDCPEVPVGPEGVLCRVVVATHPEGKKKSRVGVTRAGLVYELFFTALPQQAFTAADVVELYLHRGAFEPTLADEDPEQDPDRWCSHSAWGQECWQVVSQWVWNEAPGKRGASPEPTFLSSLMGRSCVQQESLFTPRSGKDQADGSLRVVYAASIGHCRPCPPREQCQWNGSATTKPAPA